MQKWNCRIVIVYILLLLLSLCSAYSWARQAEVGSVVIDGKKTIAMGWWGAGRLSAPGALDHLDECAEHGFDFVMQGVFTASVECNPCNIEEVIAYMDVAEAKGIKVMVHVANLDHIERACGLQPNLMAPRINAVKDHNALLGYYLADEPDGRYCDNRVQCDSPENMKLLYDELRAHDPDMNHPTCIAFNKDLTTACTQAYFPTIQMAMQECYPTDWNPTYADEYHLIPADVAVAKAEGIDYMTLPRLFGDPFIDFPTAWEFRYMVFAPISVGAGGIIPHTSEGFILDSNFVRHAPEPGFRDKIVYPATDLLREIRPILLKGSEGMKASSYMGDVRYDGDITWVFAGDSDEAVLLAVNNNGSLSRLSVDFIFSGLNPSILKAIVLGENRMIRLDANGYLIDDFKPYEVHVYRFKR